MKLRSQISLFLLFLGLAPLLIAIAVHVPLVFEKLEQFYHKAYLQQLRADFRDLDQHITRRQEMVRLLAKLPEPGITPLDENEPDVSQLRQARLAYTDWVNRVLFDQLDITQVIFIDKHGKVSLSLSRSPQTGMLASDEFATNLPRLDFLSAGLKIAPGSVLTSPISLNDVSESNLSKQFMTLSFISPVIAAYGNESTPTLQGVVVINLDVGGLAHVYNGIYWVQDNGQYLSDPSSQDIPTSTAFRDFPGLDKLFAKEQLGLWDQGGQQIFWLPLFTVQDGGHLWVGRSVDPSPIAEFSRMLEIRFILVISLLLLVVYFVARLFAIRADRISDELTGKMTSVLEQDKAVTFSWSRPEELRLLGNTLSQLSVKHADDTRALREHARELENSNRYKSEFLANVSHELRTPLNSILLLSKMLASEDSKLEPESRQQAQVIHDAGSDLRALIDTILDLSRIEAGKAALNIGNIELHEFLSDLVTLMQPQFSYKGLELKLDIQKNAPHLLVSDAEKLRQVIINFLSNALKFTEKGCISIRLHSSAEKYVDKLPISISVKDSGIGIPAAEQSQVFEAFKQVDGSTSRRYGGTGLGLTISRELATLLGGMIEVSSAVNSGSTFTLLLPARLDRASEAEAVPDNSRSSAYTGHEPSAESNIVTAADFSRCRVLVIENDIHSLLELTPMLENWGIQVVAAGDAPEALDTLAEDQAFDLILMTINMPEMDAVTLIDRIRAGATLSEIPIITLVDKYAQEELQQVRDSGVNDVIYKPFISSVVKEILDQFLSHAATQGAS